ncbi:aconitase X swivel domain-containing protein [Lutispora sp.]|uniref:aconitase X swivel domain-containing protein n=1 Tax=Lutispora sp. TaxID=2828727 RepID=UPI00356866F3
MKKIILKGRPTHGGVAEGKAVVCPDSIAGNSGAVGDLDGVIHENSSSNKGVSIKDTILVLPCGKGSTGFSAHFKSAKLMGICPAGWVIKKMDSRLGVAVASLDVPAVSDFEEDDPMEVIRTGDWVKIDGSTGIVEITRE